MALISESASEKLMIFSYMVLVKSLRSQRGVTKINKIFQSLNSHTGSTWANLGF